MEPRLRGAVTAVSLTGNFFQRGDTPQGFWLNGDHNVALFGSSFDDYKARLELVNYPLVYRDRAAMQGVLKATCLASTRWNALGVQKGLIGVGMAIAPGRKLEDNAPDLQPIRDHVTRLREACDSLVGADRYEKWVPVCDTANLLIWVPPPKDFPKVPDQATVSRIKEDLLPEVNARLLTVTEEQLKSVPSLVLVAGSVQKAPAIYKWMRDFKIRYLCTDSSAAERLLEIASIGTYE
jgi:hypothetical protein